MNAPRSLLTIASVIAGIAEAAMAVDFALTDNDPAGYLPAGVFAAAFLALAWAVGTQRGWPAIGLAVLFALEIAFAPFYPRESVADWVIQLGFVAISAIGLVAAIALLVSRRPGRGLSRASRHPETTNSRTGA